MGVEKEESFGLNWYETSFRGYDAQLGRFHQIDLLADRFAPITPYSYAVNDPILLSDPTGLAPSLKSFLNDLFAKAKDGDIFTGDEINRAYKEVSRLGDNEKYDLERAKDGSGIWVDINEEQYSSDGALLVFAASIGEEAGVLARKSTFVKAKGRDDRGTFVRALMPEEGDHVTAPLPWYSMFWNTNDTPYEVNSLGSTNGRYKPNQLELVMVNGGPAKGLQIVNGALRITKGTYNLSLPDRLRKGFFSIKDLRQVKGYKDARVVKAPIDVKRGTPFNYKEYEKGVLNVRVATTGRRNFWNKIRDWAAILGEGGRAGWF